MTYPDPPPDPPLVYGPDPVPPPPRRPIGRFDLIGATACVAVLIGLGVGVLVGSDGDDKPTPKTTHSITYEITGDENGPVTETLELTNQEDVNFTPTHLSTSGSGVDIEVEITDVESY